MKKITTGSRLYPQKMSVGLVISGQYAGAVHMRYLVRYDFPMLPAGSWYQLRVRPSALVAMWLIMSCWKGFLMTLEYVSRTCSCSEETGLLVVISKHTIGAVNNSGHDINKISDRGACFDKINGFGKVCAA